MINKKYLKNRKNIIKYSYKVTKSMEMVSILKLKSLENKLLVNNFYNKFILNLLNNINFNKYNDFYIRNNIIFNKILFILVFTDQGLCGNLNINLFNNFIYFIKKKKFINKKIYLVLVGKISQLFIKNFNRLKLKFIFISKKLFINNLLNDNFYLNKLIKKLLKIYNFNLDIKYYIIYNLFKNNNINIKIIKLLPIKSLNKCILNKNYVYNNNSFLIDNKIFLKYVESIIYNSLLNNLVSENFSRILVMKSASKNSENLYNKLNLMYNKLRQFDITNELIELVSSLNTL